MDHIHFTNQVTGHNVAHELFTTDDGSSSYFEKTKTDFISLVR